MGIFTTHHNYKYSSNMFGPFPLSDEEVSKAKYDNRGVYLLADKSSWTDKYVIKYVGRGNLRDRLKNEHMGKYEFFYYRVFPSKAGRFKKECEEFHRYGKSENLNTRFIHQDLTIPFQNVLN